MFDLSFHCLKLSSPYGQICENVDFLWLNLSHLKSTLNPIIIIIIIIIIIGFLFSARLEVFSQ